MRFVCVFFLVCLLPSALLSPCRAAAPPDSKAWLERFIAWETDKIVKDVERVWEDVLRPAEIDPYMYKLGDGTVPPPGSLRDRLQKKLPALKETIREAFRSRITMDQAWEVKLWLDRPEVQKMWSLLGQAARPDLDEQRRAWVQANIPFPEERRVIFARFQEVWPHSERKMAMKFYPECVSRFDLKPQSFDLPSLPQELREQWADTLARDQAVFASVVWFAWRDIPDPDVKRFIDFLETGSGNVWAQAFHAAYLKGMELAAIAWWELFQ